MVEKVLSEVGEEVTSLVHLDELAFVRFIGFERFQFAIRCDSFYSLGFLLFLVIRHQIPVFLSCSVVFRG